MALTKFPIVSVVLVLLAAGQGTDGSCNINEMQSMLSCYTLYSQSFLDAFGRVTGTPCNTTRITKDVCCWLSGIVKCLKGKDLDEDTCYPTIASTIDDASVIPCKVQQLFNACPNAPCIAQHGQNCEAGNNKTDDCPDEDETNDDSDKDKTNDDSDKDESNVGKHKGETKDGPYNCAGMSASPILWLTSLMATCLAVLWAARSG